MTVVELRSAIHKVVEEIPSEKLDEVLNLLKQFTQSDEDDELDKHFAKVVNENRGLLERLAK